MIYAYTIYNIYVKHIHSDRISPSEREQKFDDVKDDLNATEYRESSEKPHGASNKTQGSLQSHLHIFLNLVVSRDTKKDVDHFQSWIINGAS